MKTPFTMLLVIAGGYFIPPAGFAQTTYVDNGTSTNYTLQTGDSLYIKQGIFTGTVTNWNSGGRITIAAGATFQPASVNGYKSRYTVYGAMIVPSLQTATGFSLYNYGVVTVNGNTQFNESAQTLVNNTGANIYFNGSVDVNAGGSSITNHANIAISSNFNLYANGTTITNYADITVGGGLNMYSNTSVTNAKNLTIGGSFNSSQGQFNNQGRFQAQQAITFGNSTTFTNTCRTIAGNGITINGATIYNSGLLLASNASSFTNSGTIISSGNGVIKSGAFTNYNIMRGNGFMYITGKSTLGGGATIGVNTATTDSLKIYTVNRTKTTQIFDDQWGTVYPNAKYAQFQAPDTTGFAQYSCAEEYKALAILPATWLSFTVKSVNDLPLINWSADFSNAVYTVQRSINGIDFTPITTVAGRSGINQYSFTDNTLPADYALTLYYRVCATLQSGIQKYTEVKSLKTGHLDNHITRLTAAPNPFTSYFTISCNIQQKREVTVKVFNFSGNAVYIKQVAVNAGYNTITVDDTGKWLRGIYFVQLVYGNETVVTAKVIRQ